MDLGSFYAQQGQLEGLRQLHWMLLNDPSDSGLLLGEAIAREKLARSGTGGTCGLAPNSVAIGKRRQKQWRKTDLMIARLERQRTTNAHQGIDRASTRLLSQDSHQPSAEGGAKKCVETAEALFNNRRGHRHLAKWRRNFNAFIWRLYNGKSKHRTLFNRVTMVCTLRLLREEQQSEGNAPVARRRLGTRYEVGVREGKEVLLQRGTGRVFVPLEELFDTLQRFHAERGHSSYRVALYAEAGTRFANVGRELLCEYLNGFEQFLLDAEAEETTMVALAAAQGDAGLVQKEEE